MKHILYVFIFISSFLSFSQQLEYVNFIAASIDIKPNPKDKSVTGSVIYEFEILKDVDSIFIDAIDMRFDAIILDYELVEYDYDNQKLWIKESFKKGKYHILKIDYKVQPKKALYFFGWEDEGRDQIWTQGQGKYTSHWLPSFDDINEKVEFDMMITFDKDYQVIANGKLINKKEYDNLITWKYDMLNPMSSYLLAFAIGKYDKKVEISRSGIPLELYYYPEDSLKVEPTYRYSRQMFDFLEEEIGVTYSWQNYKQIPVRDFLYAGMENTTTTIFADNFITDAIGFNDRNYVNVNAHELAHQWFGDLITEASGIHHWLQEGFATYYALLVEKEVFGDDYFYWQLYQNAQELELQDSQGQGTSLLDPKSSSLTFYQRGAWVLFMLRKEVGDEHFRTAVKNYLEKYRFQNVVTLDFMFEVEQMSGQDLTHFVHQWIMSNTFPYEDAITALKQDATFISEYEIVNCDVANSKCREQITYPISDKAKVKLISQAPQIITKETFKNSLEVRQAIAVNLRDIPVSLKAEYETLLDDESYQTIESALFNLWSNFRSDRAKYLDKTKEVHGFSNKNIKTLWLALAIVTPDYKTNQKAELLEELNYYTSPIFGFEVRQNAFQFLNLIQQCGSRCQEHLEHAKKHPNWRFSSFAKNLQIRK